VEASRERSGSLEVTTAEGDKVSISFSAVQQSEAGSVEGRGGRGQRLRAEEARQSSSVEVAVNVEGSLNDQEVADISKLLQKLTAAARGQASPKAAPASASDQASQRGLPPAYQTIQNFQFQYQEQTAVRVSHSYLG
jgi:hypothetical protein